MLIEPSVVGDNLSPADYPLVDALGFNENILTLAEKKEFQKRDILTLREAIILSIGAHPDRLLSLDEMYQEHYQIRLEIVQCDIDRNRIQLERLSYPSQNSKIQIKHFCQYLFQEDWSIPKWFFSHSMDLFWSYLQETLSSEMIKVIQLCSYLESHSITVPLLKSFFDVEVTEKGIEELKKMKVLFDEEENYLRMNFRFQKFIQHQIENDYRYSKEFISELIEKFSNLIENDKVQPELLFIHVHHFVSKCKRLNYLEAYKYLEVWRNQVKHQFKYYESLEQDD